MPPPLSSVDPTSGSLAGDGLNRSRAAGAMVAARYTLRLSPDLARRLLEVSEQPSGAPA